MTGLARPTAPSPAAIGLWAAKARPTQNGIESLMALRITPAFFDLRHLIVALAATSCTVHAQMVEELEFRKEAGNAVVQVRFGSAIQFQRSIASRSGDLFQVFYNVVSGNETDLTLVGERRVSNGRGLPEFVLTDEAVNRDNLTRRKLLVRFNGATKVKFRAGNNKQSLELVFEGMASSLEAVEKSKQPDVAPSRFAVNLQTGPERTEGLTGAIPSAFQDAVVFTSQRVVNGVTQYDINLGYFESLPSAQAAAAQLSKRFPAAVAYEMRPPVAPASSAVATGPLAAGTVTQASPNAAIAASGDVEGQAKTLHQLGLAALDRGDYQEAITAFDGVLALPVNSLTRPTQEKWVSPAWNPETGHGPVQSLKPLSPLIRKAKTVTVYASILPICRPMKSCRSEAKAAAAECGQWVRVIVLLRRSVPNAFTGLCRFAFGWTPCLAITR